MKKAFSIAAVLAILVAPVSSVSSGSDFDWKQPLDVESTEFPVDICGELAPTGEHDYYFEVELSNVNSDGTLTLEEKSSSSHATWSDVDDTSVKSEWSTQRYFFEDAGEDFFVNESDSNTVTIDGNEHTFEVGAIDVGSSSFSNLKVDGIDDNADDEGDILSENPESKYYKVKDVTSLQWDDGTETIEIEAYDKITLSTGNTDYRFRFDPGGDQRVSEPAYLTCDSRKVAAPNGVESDSQTVGPFAPYSFTHGIAPASSIAVNISNPEQDDYNVTLYDGSDTAVARIGKQDDVFSATSAADTIGDFVVFWDSDEDVSKFSNYGNNFLSNSANNYTFYMKIEDALASTRYTPEYQISTSGSNDVPSIDSFEAYNGSWHPVEDVAFGEDQIQRVRAQVTDSNNDRHDAYLNLSNNFDNFYKVEEKYYSEQGSGTTYIWNLSSLDNPDILDSKNWSARVRVSDGAASDTEYRTWTYPFGELNITASNSTDNVTKNTEFKVNLTVECPQYECINQNESIDVYLDPEEVEIQDNIAKPRPEQNVLSFQYWMAWIDRVIV